MADKTYLKRRRQGWAFSLAVPVDVRHIFKTDRIVIGLGTQDLAVAQSKRWELMAQHVAAFERARSGTGLSRGEIEEAARDAHAHYLVELDAQKADDPERESDNLEATAFAVMDALEDNDERFATAEIAATERRLGVVLPPGSAPRAELAHALTRAYLAAVNGRAAALAGRVPTVPKAFGANPVDPLTLRPWAPPPPKGKPAAPEELRFGEAGERYLAETERDAGAKLTAQTKGQHEASFRLFKEWANDPALSAVTRAQAADFLDTIAKLPPNWGRSPATRTTPLGVLLQRHKDAPRGLTNKTLNRHANALAMVWTWAKRRGHFTGENPFAEQSRPKAPRRQTGYLPFTDAELAAIFGGPAFRVPERDRLMPAAHDTVTAMRWVTLIALFSGMRSGEICQLRAADVRNDGGIMFFDVHGDGDGQSVKTDASVRRVPVHSMLLRCGFVTYLEHVRAHPSGRLFPGLKPGGPDGKLNWYFAGRFTEYRRSVGVVRERVTFHSFRKNVGTALEQARIPENEVVQFLGHEKMSMSYSVYSLGIELPALKDIAEKIVYPGLDLSHLYPADTSGDPRSP